MFFKYISIINRPRRELSDFLIKKTHLVLELIFQTDIFPDPKQEVMSLNRLFSLTLKNKVTEYYLPDRSKTDALFCCTS